MAKAVYFKNLNGFRCIAAVLVVICHLELFKDKISLPNAWQFPLIFEAGGAGVDFFFVLSGFLITSLLLAEQETTGQIFLKKFYIRRILRIWPLYFLIVVLCFLIIPHISLFEIGGYSNLLYTHFNTKLLFCLILMPNVALAFLGEMPYAGPLWSVGVEEQFYIFWPLLMKLSPKITQTILGFIFCFVGLKILLLVVGKTNLLSTAHYEALKNFIVGLRMECMGIGGLGAWLYFRKHRLAQFLSANAIGLAAIIAVPLLFFVTSYLLELHHIILSILFLCIILNGATNPATFIKLEAKPIHLLGTISYGLYLWHPICIGFTIWMMKCANLWVQPIGSLIYYFVAVASTIVLAYLSYRFFEQPFLNAKKRFTVIVSGNSARPIRS